MAGVVGRTLFTGRVGKEESAPVGDATDDAAGGENNVAGCAGDSGRGQKM